MKELHKNKIESMITGKLTHLEYYNVVSDKVTFRNVDIFNNNLLFLPAGDKLTAGEIGRICGIILDTSRKTFRKMIKPYLIT